MRYLLLLFLLATAAFGQQSKLTPEQKQAWQDWCSNSDQFYETKEARVAWERKGYQIPQAVQITTERTEPDATPEQLLIASLDTFAIAVWQCGLENSLFGGCDELLLSAYTGKAFCELQLGRIKEAESSYQLALCSCPKRVLTTMNKIRHQVIK